MADETPVQDTLTPEQKTYFEAELKKAGETAVNSHKTAAETARAAAIPKEYQFTFDDKTPLDPKTDAETIAAQARKLGLSAEQAKDFAKHHETFAGTVVARQKQAHDTEVAGWKTALKADKEYGGEHWAATEPRVKRVMDAYKAKYPDSPFGSILTDTGYGDHPEWVRFVNWIGQVAREDNPTGGFGGGKPKPREAWEEVYGPKT